ncbi:MAG: UDP-N-acetylglucosamine 2-epimerase [uncultured Pyrinomonadaceae bacterium]|uniref:UDP-N-acetylglucosamine 2-epimerase n=1 Tax=uncultured Pyrinomonadaceae bacterium TaxID=2283094 RepID=A0A6J4Q5P9_9BACT|nr:MAG: UDP-N-acetylglucosamine 2-epimerase [uncultured Pyrinomonadaceae bacterium]
MNKLETESRRKIAVVTTSRADYGHLYWTLKELENRPQIDLQIIALGAHFSPEFGRTFREIEADGLTIDERVECLISSDSDVGMAKTIGVATLGLADVLGRMRPDVLLLIADRYEMLAPAAVALALRIPIAHVEGGDISEGAIDDAVRNALTKMSHLHFTTNENSRKRVLAMGEEAWRVHLVGSPSLDNLRRRKLFSQAELEADLNLDFKRKTVVIAYHPVTLARDTVIEADAVFDALERLAHQIVFCYPNSDAGSFQLIERARMFCETRPNAQLFVNLNHLKYWSLLKYSDLLVGNSSSGIMETASIPLPTVNIGMRQRGREKPLNVLDAAPETDSIARAIETGLSANFRKSLQGMTNPYGDGRAAERIVEVLAAVSLGDELLIKRAVPVENSPQRFAETSEIL